MTVLTAADPRLDALARLLFEQHHQTAGTMTEWTMREWDAGPQHVNREPWQARAREVLRLVERAASIRREHGVRVSYPHWDGHSELWPSDQATAVKRVHHHRGQGATAELVERVVSTGEWQTVSLPD